MNPTQTGSNELNLISHELKLLFVELNVEFDVLPRFHVSDNLNFQTYIVVSKLMSFLKKACKIGHCTYVKALDLTGVKS